MDTNNNNNVSLRLRDTLAGAFGSICLTYAGLPFDVVKVRMQSSSIASSLSSPITSLPSKPTLSPLQVARSIIQDEGILRLWRGAGPALTSAMVENTVVFTANGFFTRLYSNFLNSYHHPKQDNLDTSKQSVKIITEDELNFAEHFMLGGLSGIFSATAICPPEVVKCRLQYYRNTLSQSTIPSSAGGTVATTTESIPSTIYRNSLTCTKYIYQTEGIKGFFSGLQPLLYRDVPFNTLFFGFYRVYSSLLNFSMFSPANNNNNGGGLRAFLAGGFAGMTAWTIIFPFDVIKTKMQILGNKNSGNKGTLTLIQEIIKENGIKRLYYGSLPAILRAFPANAALFWGVETAKVILQDIGLE